MFGLFKKAKILNNLQESRLFDETSFYDSFIRDLKNCKNELFIESPFVISARMKVLIPLFKKLLAKGVKIHIITRHPSEHEGEFAYQATEEILACSEIRVHITFVKNHHRKLAIIDKTILYEGSLNILSHTNSREIMRRIEGKLAVSEMWKFLKLNQIIG